MAVCADVMDRPWQWGVADCCTAACDVFVRLHGLDPMQPLRGRYSTEMGAARHIARAGGWLAMGDALAARAALVLTSAPVAGDIGVIRDAAGRLALGICVGDGMWAGKTERGFATVSKFLRAWHAA